MSSRYFKIFRFAFLVMFVAFLGFSAAHHHEVGHHQPEAPCSVCHVVSTGSQVVLDSNVVSIRPDEITFRLLDIEKSFFFSLFYLQSSIRGPPTIS